MSRTKNRSASDNLITGTHHLMKSLNRGVILDLLRRESSLSRIELSKLTGLDAKTITNLVRELLQEKIVVAAGYQKKKKGRSPQNINLNGDYGYSLGVDLGASHIRAGLVNFNAELIFCREELITPRDTHVSIVKKMVCTCRSILKEFPDKRGKVGAVCLAAPGFLNREKGEIIHSVNLPGFASPSASDPLYTGPAELDHDPLVTGMPPTRRHNTERGSA